MTKKRKASPPDRGNAANHGTTTDRKIRRGGGKRKADGREIVDLLYGNPEPKAGKQLKLEFDPEGPITRASIRFLPARTAFYVGRLAGRLIAEENPVALSGYAHGKREADR